MNRTPVESSQIVSIGHDPETQTMEIEFKDRHGVQRAPIVYLYSNVTAEDHAALIGAESIGRHFGAFIKPFPQKYPFQKIQ